MAADWTTFISDVSDKLASQSIGSYEEMADFLRNEYISATVGKAASPYGEMHVQGNDAVLFDGFKSGFKILYEGGDLTFEEKKTSPEYADLDVQPPTIDISGAADQVDLDFKDWCDKNKATIPPFVYSQFFSQYPNFPKNQEQAALEIARKILYQFDGTPAYLEWMYSLRTGQYSDWGNLVMDQVINIIKGSQYSINPGDQVRAILKKSPNNSVIGKISKTIGDSTYITYFDKPTNKDVTSEIDPSTATKIITLSDIASNVPSLSISNEVFQDRHLSNPNKIPDYMSAEFITKFTYSASDSVLLSKILENSNFTDLEIKNILSDFNTGDEYSGDLFNILSGKSGLINIVNNQSFIGNDIEYYRMVAQSQKISQYISEEARFRNLKIRWINEIADKARKNEDPDKPEDAYNVMAKGVLDYWKSCGPQPLTNEPGAPPCTFSPPQGGVYAPIYYGSQTMLGNNIKRAFNTGKRFTQAEEKMVAAKMVASALAYSFAMHLLELKFIYQGGIPGPDGPLPMIGFIPLVY